MDWLCDSIGWEQVGVDGVGWDVVAVDGQSVTQSVAVGSDPQAGVGA